MAKGSTITLDQAFSNLPILSTERLIIRKLETTDVRGIFAIKSDELVTHPYGLEPHRSIEETLGWIEKREADYRNRAVIYWAFALKEKENEVVGSCCFWNFTPDFHCAEIGYEVNRQYWKKGLMTEALHSLLSFGFEELGLHRVEALPPATNEASVRLLEKLGFNLEGRMRDRIFFQGRFVDQLTFGLLDLDWRGREDKD